MGQDEAIAKLVAACEHALMVYDPYDFPTVFQEMREAIAMAEFEAKARLSVKGVPLVSMGQNNKAVLDFYRDGKEEGPMIPNGIACPDCGNELSDSFEGIQRGSFPEIIGVNCIQCGWGGNRYVMPREAKAKK